MLRRQKRIDILLEAVPAVLARVPDARIVVVGNGPLRDELMARARSLGVGGSVHFIPFAHPPQRYLHAIDVFVLPSEWEALPIGLLEALACGVPQVATDVGGVGEVVTESTGCLVPPGDPAALADAMSDLLLDGRRRRRLGEASRRRHGDLFRVERTVAQTAAVYEEVLRRPARHVAPQTSAPRSAALPRAVDAQPASNILR